MPQIVLSAYEATAGFPSDDGDDGDYGLMWPSIDDFCEVPPRSQRRQGSGTQQPHIVLNIPQGLNPLYNPLYNRVINLLAAQPLINSMNPSLAHGDSIVHAKMPWS